MDAFKVEVNGKIFDYRLGEELNLEAVGKFFGKKYKVKKIWSGARHVLGILQKGKSDYFLKLSKGEGISIVTKNEYGWNEVFNKEVNRKSSKFLVPKNYDSGFWREKYFYLVTDIFEGELLADIDDFGARGNFTKKIEDVVDLSEFVQNLKLNSFGQEYSFVGARDNLFFAKCKSWFSGIPKGIRDKFRVWELMELVEKGQTSLKKAPKHGDFTAWHIFDLGGGRFGLIDGEHATVSSVEYYDIAYFVQRVLSVLKREELAKEIIRHLEKRKYNLEKLKIVLAARAIGGFLDESLTTLPNYSSAVRFRRFVLKI